MNLRVGERYAIIYRTRLMKRSRITILNYQGVDPAGQLVFSLVPGSEISIQPGDVQSITKVGWGQRTAPPRPA